MVTTVRGRRELQTMRAVALVTALLLFGTEIWNSGASLIRDGFSERIVVTPYAAMVLAAGPLLVLLRASQQRIEPPGLVTAIAVGAGAAATLGAVSGTWIPSALAAPTLLLLTTGLLRRRRRVDPLPPSRQSSPPPRSRRGEPS